MFTNLEMTFSGLTNYVQTLERHDWRDRLIKIMQITGFDDIAQEVARNLESKRSALLAALK